MTGEFVAVALLVVYLAVRLSDTRKELRRLFLQQALTLNEANKRQGSDQRTFLGQAEGVSRLSADGEGA